MIQIINPLEISEKHPMQIAMKLQQIADQAYDYPTPWRREQLYESLILKTTRVLVAIDRKSKKWLGFVLAVSTPDFFDIYLLAVNHSVQNQGIATQLLQELLLLAQESGAEQVLLEVRSKNSAARHVYQKLGFEETGRIKKYYNRPQDDAIRMNYILSKEKVEEKL